MHDDVTLCTRLLIPRVDGRVRVSAERHARPPPLPWPSTLLPACVCERVIVCVCVCMCVLLVCAWACVCVCVCACVCAASVLLVCC